MNSDAARVRTFLNSLMSHMYKVAVIHIPDSRRSREIATDLEKDGSLLIVDCIEEILPSLHPSREGNEEIADLVENLARKTDKPLFLKDFDVVLSVLPGCKSEALQLLSSLSRARPARAIGLELHRHDLVPPDFPKERILKF